MKKLLGSLYLLTQGTYVSRERECLMVSADGKKRKVPVLMINNVLCFGNININPFAMGLCCEKGICISFFTEHGRFLAQVHGKTSGNVVLRMEQYRRHNEPECSAEISATIVAGKILNSRNNLRRLLSDHSDKIGAEAAQKVDQVRIMLKQNAAAVLNSNHTTDIIRGFEGISSKLYFSVFEHMILNRQNEFSFDGRNRRPPKDRVNALLSFVYAIVLNDVRSALEGVGLDPAVGFLHRLRPGRPSLALDIMEEFRASIADRLVLSLINRCQVDPADFEEATGGTVLLNENGRKSILEAYSKKKNEEITHPYLKEKLQLGLVYHAQARIFARFLRRDLDSYPPFIPV